MRLGLRAGLAAEAAVAAQHGGGGEGGDGLAAGLVDDGALGVEDSALVLALVEQVDDAPAADDLAFRRHRPVQGQVLLAVQDLRVVDGRLLAAEPVAGRGEHHRHGRKRHEALLVDELEIVAMRAVGAAAEAQRVKDGVLLGIGVLDVGELPVQDFLRI